MSRTTRTTPSAPLLLLCIILIIMLAVSSCTAFAPLSNKNKLACPVTLVLSSSSADSSSSSSSSSSSQERDDLLKKASQLRQEASELESKLKRKSPSVNTTAAAAATFSMQPPAYNSLDDSVWMFSYRFSDQPESRDTAKKEKDTTPSSRTFYAGKLTLKLRSDGFTDIVSHEATSSLKLDVVKAWGWDVETSNEDNKDYVMFSIDATIPAATTIGPAAAAAAAVTQRFYFQARQESSSAASGIALKEGTVAVKQDVIDSKAPGWGLFSTRGILAEFRRVGDFNAKPTRVVVEE